MKKIVIYLLFILLTTSWLTACDDGLVTKDKEPFEDEPAEEQLSSEAHIAAGGFHTVGLNKEGYVVSAGSNSHGQGKLGSWSEIHAIAAGSYHTLGLKADGTVLMAGSTVSPSGVNDPDKCNIDSWTDIIQVAAGGCRKKSHSVGLRSDGTLVACGDNSSGQCNVNDFTNIIQVSAGGEHTVALRKDGTVTAVGKNSFGQLDVDMWVDIIQIAAGVEHTIGLKADGSIVAVGDNEGGQLAVSEWKDIVQVAAGDFHSVGLKSDGTVVAAGSNEMGQTDVAVWSDIVQIAAGWDHTVGLKPDNTALATGDGSMGQTILDGPFNSLLSLSDSGEPIIADNPAMIDLIELTADSITFTVNNIGEIGAEYILESKDFQIIDTVDNAEEAVFTLNDLEPDTHYSLSLVEENSDNKLDEIVFRTFKNKASGCQLYYLICARSAREHKLTVKIFGSIRDMNSFSLDNNGYHFINGVGIAENSLEVLAPSYSADESEKKVTINASSVQTYFRVSYVVDKTELFIEDMGSWLSEIYLGYIDSHYLMTTGEMLMLTPSGFRGIDQLKKELNTFEMYGYLNHPAHWEKAIGFDVEDDLINFLSRLEGRRAEGVEASVFYAYSRDHFNTRVENVDGTDVLVVLENNLDESSFEDIFNIYKKLAEVWGSGIGDDRYVVMIVNDHRNLYGGEWTSGQGYASSYGIVSQILPHQIYHRWNGWERKISFQIDEGGFWSEGFNDFYADKVRTELGLIEHDDLKGYFNWYRSIRGTSIDVPILQFQKGRDDIRISYQKGALLAYLLDQEIRVESDNRYSLDDVLRISWQRWEESEEKLTYRKIRDIIRNDFGVESIGSWWQKYVINNEPMYEEDFNF